MKESANMQEGEQEMKKKQEGFSSIQRKEPIKPETVSIKPTTNDSITKNLQAINPTIEERTSIVKESKKKKYQKQQKKQ